MRQALIYARTRAVAQSRFGDPSVRSFRRDCRPPSCRGTLRDLREHTRPYARRVGCCYRDARKEPPSRPRLQPRERRDEDSLLRKRGPWPAPLSERPSAEAFRYFHGAHSITPTTRSAAPKATRTRSAVMAVRACLCQSWTSLLSLFRTDLPSPRAAHGARGRDREVRSPTMAEPGSRIVELVGGSTNRYY